MALIRNRLIDGKRVKCDMCGRTHQVNLHSNANPTFISPESYLTTCTVLFEDDAIQIGLDRNRWAIGITRHQYVKNTGNVFYTQYIAVCPRCAYSSTNNMDMTSLVTVNLVKEKLNEVLSNNPDSVYILGGSQSERLIIEDEQQEETEEEDDWDEDEDWGDNDDNDDEEEGNNTRFNVGDNVSFVLNERQMVGVIENVGEDLYGVRSSGHCYAVTLIANMMRLFDVDNEELPPEAPQREVIDIWIHHKSKTL